MIGLFPAGVVWLVTVFIGLLGASFIRFLASGDQKRFAPILALAATAGAVLGAVFLSGRSEHLWFKAAGAALGLATLWWLLFKKREFDRG